MTFPTSLFHAHPVLPKVMMKKTRNKRERKRWRSLELPLLYLFDLLLMMLVPIENGKNYIYAPTKRIELTMCSKLVIIVFFLFP